MVLTINYPASAEENFAKGTTDTGVYFEVPAVFNVDGTCDKPATLAKVEQNLALFQLTRP